MMDRCPVCNAKYAGNRQCHRCRAEIGKLADIESAAADFREKAVSAYRTGDYGGMFHHAKRAFSLRKTPETLKLMACAAFLTRRFELAMQLRNRL